MDELDGTRRISLAHISCSGLLMLRKIFIALVALTALPMAGASYEAIASARDAQNRRVPGELMLDEPRRQLLGQCFASLKSERIARKTYRTRDEARADVFDYVERWYNLQRRHSTLGYLSPIAFEQQEALA